MGPMLATSILQSLQATFGKVNSPKIGIGTDCGHFEIQGVLRFSPSSSSDPWTICLRRIVELLQLR